MAPARLPLAPSLAMAPPTKLQFTLYYLVFTIFHHIKNKIIQISPLNSYLIFFGPSNNFGQGPPLGPLQFA
jgi:hypothetical protein